MIKVSVMYPNSPDARFDHAYYRDQHMPMVQSRMGEDCKYYTIDKGLGGAAPGVAATYIAMGHLICESIEAFQSSFGPHTKVIMGDIPNYTNVTPIIQVSEIVAG